MLLALAGCVENSEPPPLIDQLVAAGPIGLVHGALPPVYSHCGETDDMGNPYLLPGETCSLTFTRQYLGNAQDGFVSREDIYIYAVGDRNPDADPLPWAHEGTRYCSFEYTVEVEEATGLPMSDAVMLVETVTRVENFDGPWPEQYPLCSAAIPSGTQYRTLLLRGETPGVFLFKSWYGLEAEGYDLRFSGIFGVESFGCTDWWRTGEMCADNMGYTELYEACDPVNPGTGGLGYCTANCRLFEAGNGLKVCQKADTHEYPANRDLIHPAFVAYHPDLFGL